MKKIHQFRYFNKLKSVYRYNSVENRKESSAEHSWSCLILADYFLSIMKAKINRIKVYEILMYHDVIEIEMGDIPLHPNVKKVHNDDSSYINELEKKLPVPLNTKFVELYQEYKEQKTIEAKFAKAIDALDAEIHELDYKNDWKGWNEEFLIKSKAHLFNEFPEMKKIFNEIVIYLRENKYFDQ